MEKLERRGRLRAAWDRIDTSLWFVPVLMMAAGAGLAVGTIALDRRLAQRFPDVPALVYVGSSDDARELLATLLSSMITMTTLVFSITMVVLTLAASQYGPRLIRNFMASPHTQVVLGTFLMTILYCLLVLPTVGSRNEEGPAPWAVVSVAVVLTVASLVLLVVFIHTLARSIVSETVIARVGDELDAAIDELDALDAVPGGREDPQSVLPPDLDSRGTHFGPERAGYVQAVDFEALVQVAQMHDVVVALLVRPGDYVVAGGRAVAVHPGARADAALVRAVRRALALGAHRTPAQDPEFAMRHLDEIGVRALSPGINDPYTAVAVLHRMSAALARLMNHALPQAVFRDGEGKVRVICPQPTYGGLLHGALSQMRQSGAPMPLVAIHFLEGLVRIADQARLPAQIEALAAELAAMEEAVAREIKGGADRAAIGKRVDKAREALEAAAARVGGPGAGGSAGRA